MTGTIQRQPPKSRRPRAAAASARPIPAADPLAGCQPQTKLAKALWKVRQQSIAAGEPLVPMDEILNNLRRSRARHLIHHTSATPPETP
jgi:hypothetical protein